MSREPPDQSRPSPSARDYLDALGVFFLGLCFAAALGYLHAYLLRLGGYRLYHGVGIPIADWPNGASKPIRTIRRYLPRVF
jgi:hypothetical protein